MFAGKVIVGDGYGKQLGFPTANLDTTKESVNLQPGVYVAQAFLNEKKYQGALAIQAEPWKVEVNLIDYIGPDFYGEDLIVEPGKMVSEMNKMNSEEELKEKIAQDVAIIKNLLSS